MLKHLKVFSDKDKENIKNWSQYEAIWYNI